MVYHGSLLSFSLWTGMILLPWALCRTCLFSPIEIKCYCFWGHIYAGLQGSALMLERHHHSYILTALVSRVRFSVRIMGCFISRNTLLYCNNNWPECILLLVPGSSVGNHNLTRVDEVGEKLNPFRDQNALQGKNRGRRGEGVDPYYKYGM